MHVEGDSVMILVVGYQEQHVVGNFGHLSDNWKTLTKPQRGTNDFMIQHYIRLGEWLFSLRNLWKYSKFVSAIFFDQIFSNVA